MDSKKYSKCFFYFPLTLKLIIVKMNYKQLSKSISQALRHNPEKYGLKLDKDLSVPIETLIAALQSREHFAAVTRADIEAMMAESEKQRYEIIGDNIRARYGHSLSQMMERTSQQPPAVLYHGTSAAVADIILQEGLKPMNRQFVHLSIDIETAVIVGKRRAHHPTILWVDADAAWREGQAFYSGNDGTWLSTPIAPTYIKVLER